MADGSLRPRLQIFHVVVFAFWRSPLTTQEIAMKIFTPIVIAAFLLAAPLSSQALFDKKTPDEKRQELQDERVTALDKLYEDDHRSVDRVVTDIFNKCAIDFQEIYR